MWWCSAILVTILVAHCAGNLFLNLNLGQLLLIYEPNITYIPNMYHPHTWNFMQFALLHCGRKQLKLTLGHQLLQAVNWNANSDSPFLYFPRCIGYNLWFEFCATYVLPIITSPSNSLALNLLMINDPSCWLCTFLCRGRTFDTAGDVQNTIAGYDRYRPQAPLYRHPEWLYKHWFHMSEKCSNHARLW